MREKVDFVPSTPIARPRAKLAAAMRDAIVDAVDTLVRERGWSATTMADVARAAGVSRQTVYNEFGTRQELVQAYVLREIEALIAAVEAHVRAHADDARAALSGAFGLFLQLASDEPLVRIIVADAEGGELIRLLTDDRARGRQRARRRADHRGVAAGRRRRRAAGRRDPARLAISHALRPDRVGGRRRRARSPGWSARSSTRSCTPGHRRQQIAAAVA